MKENRDLLIEEEKVMENIRKYVPSHPCLHCSKLASGRGCSNCSVYFSWFKEYWRKLRYKYLDKDLVDKQYADELTRLKQESIEE